jgi:hypothetical protein
VPGPAGPAGPTGPQGPQGVPGTSGTSVTVSDTPPSSPADNSLWWESDTGNLYIRYNDGDSSQWVIASPQPDTTLFVNKAGDTMTGPLVLPGNPTTALQAAPKQYVDAVGILRSYLAGLTLSTAGSSTTFSVAPGVACDSTNVNMMSLAAALSKTTAAWAVGNAAGGLDTGAIAPSNWYHVHLIKRPDTGVVDAAVSLSPSAPTLGANIPAAYSISRRIGSMRTNASSQWTAFTQNGDEFLWAAGVQDYSNAAFSGGVNVAITLSAPLGISTKVMFRSMFTNTGTAGAGILLSSALTAIQLAATPSGNMSLSNPVVNQYSAAEFSIWTNTASQINLSGTTAANNSFFAITYGWIDHRGRDA